MGLIFEAYVSSNGRTASTAAGDTGKVLIGATGPRAAGVATLSLENAIEYRRALDEAIGEEA